MSRRGQVARAAGLACLALAIAFSAARPGAAAAQTKAYTWVDATGRLRISDRPPPPGVEEVEAVLLRPVNGLGGLDAGGETPASPQDAAAPPVDVDPVASDEPDPEGSEFGAAAPEESVSAGGAEGEKPSSGEDASAEGAGEGPDAPRVATDPATNPAAEKPAEDAADASEDAPAPALSVEERIRAWRRRAAGARRGAAVLREGESAGAPPTRSQRREGATEPEREPAEEPTEAEQALRRWVWDL